MRRFRVAAVAGLVGASAPLYGQMHAVKAPETVVRAVAVYEWTGDEDKPSASRVVPVSIFINSQMEDAGVYMTRPAPLALDRGTVFEVEQGGKLQGTLELGYQRHFEGIAGTVFDDGWVGYGAFKPVPKEPVVAALKKSGNLPVVVASGGTKPKDEDADPDKPVLLRREGSDSPPDTKPDTTAATPARTDAGASTKSDTDKPTMRRRDPDATDTTDSTSTNDVDRPTLKKRTPQQPGDKKRPQGDVASVRSVGSLNDDPDRPTLHRGQAVGDSVSPLLGLPKDMRQLVAVSDAKDREEHDFARPWESTAEKNDVLARMQDLARDRLAKYDVPAPAVAVAEPPPPAPVKPGVRSKKPVATTPLPAPPAELAEESLHAFTLSYGGADTFVYTATSPGSGGVTRYVTVVAQREGPSNLKPALTSVTDSKHLDRTPWMRFVDVVDAEASNRASLLFEMRAQVVRQFALYRVIGARAEQVFETGTTQ